MALDTFPQCFRLFPRAIAHAFPQHRCLLRHSPVLKERCARHTLRAELQSKPQLPISSAQNDDDDDCDHCCMICIEHSPLFVMSPCGHFGICNRCRTSLYLAQNNKNKQRHVSRNEVVWKKLFRLKVSCPYCRAVSSTVHKRDFEGTLHEC